jgi:hypothetical protein
MIIAKQMFKKAENVFVGGLSLSKHPFYELGTVKLKKKGRLPL